MKIKILLLLMSLLGTQMLFGVSSTWIGGTGSWDVPGNWSAGSVPDATTEVLIPVTGNVTIPAGFTANALSVTVQGVSKLLIAETAVLNISNSPSVALTIINGAKFQNKGFLNIGSAGPIAANGISIESSLSQCFNDTTGVVNINNISAFAVTINLVGKFINAGDLNIGSTGSIGFGGFSMDNVTTLENHGTGVININNSPTGDGMYIQDSNISNDGEIHIGNLSPILGRGISLELGSFFSNSSTATTSVSRITNGGSTEGVALYLSSNSSFSNSGDLLIGNNEAVNTTGIMMFFESTFTNQSNGLIEINNITNLDGISLSDEFTNFFNAGIIRIGNDATVRRNGIFLSNLALMSNQGTGDINIDNINGTGSTEGHGIYMANAGLTNVGDINLGTNFSIARYGIYVSAAAAILNQNGASIKVNNVANIDGISLTGTNSTITNNGSIDIGNLLAVKSIGISMFLSSVFNNNGTGTITINNITNTLNTAGFGAFIGNSTFTNAGTINIGSISPLFNLGIFVSSGSLVNQSSGAIQINNILTFDGLYGSGVGTSISNNGSIKIGNLSPVKRFGVFLGTSAAMQNLAGSLEINGITGIAASQGYGIALIGGASFINNTTINIGNLSPISQLGILFNSPSTFTNQTNGVIKINNITSFDGIQMSGTASVLNNAGQIKIGDSGPVTRVGILISAAQFNNQAGGLLEINNIPTLDGLNVGTTGATMTNNGTINLGNISGIYRFGIILGTPSAFTNGSTGVLTINNILSTAANEGIALRLSACNFINNNVVNIGNLSNISRFGIAMSSSALLTNNSTGSLQVNRITSQSGISLQLTSKITNNGSIQIGNLAPINVVGLTANGASEILNNAGSSISINNTTTLDALYLSGTSTKMVNAATLNIGNLFSIGGRGINLDLAALLQNTTSGIINIDNTTTEAILLDGTGTLFDNKGMLHILP
ncbi:MAG: hypothetical protein IPO65_08845 [Saprospiraceae bacterium]|nr:hypothetical protein [Saprospiraceae bacterium]